MSEEGTMPIARFAQHWMRRGDLAHCSDSLLWLADPPAFEQRPLDVACVPSVASTEPPAATYYLMRFA
jgi:hypothetical protein